MNKFGKIVVKFRIPILIVSLLLLVPSVIGMVNTRINYDMLSYLPKNIDTVKGQDILMDDFGKGAFSIIMVDGMTPKQISDLRGEIEKVDHVDSVIWYDSVMDITVPMELLPEKFYDAFNKDNETLMAVFFDTSSSANETMDAISEIRSIAGKNCYISGISAMVTDLKALCEKEEPIYVGLAVLFATAAMMIFLDSWILPFVFLASIGIAILYNLGTNIALGEISYITKALAAVLQLAVTMDYSIFLWHSYSEEQLKNNDKKKAMAKAIANTITSVVGSSITTIAGFIALCFMSYTLGFDLGIVMAKGVLLGVLGCVTILPSMILLLDKPIEKLRHKPLLPKMDKLAGFITKHWIISLVCFVLIAIPAFYGYKNTAMYYDLGATLPENMEYVIANTKLSEEFNMGATHMILADSKLSSKDSKAMLEEINSLEGVKLAVGFDSLVGSAVPEEFIPSSITDILKSDKYQLILVNSEYTTASDEVNRQIDQINNIIDNYDDSAMLIGEAPGTKDLIEITDHDFNVVNIVSIIAVFIIIALVLKSLSLPVVLVAVIEFAIFVNLGIPYYTNTTLPFIAPICISTIQLGATVDYAILMTTRYKKERYEGEDKKNAVKNALAASASSIIVSGVSFFAATFGVGIYSDVDIISSLCNLLARGAAVSMFSVLLVLPALLLLCDKIICVSSLGFKRKVK